MYCSWSLVLDCWETRREWRPVADVMSMGMYSSGSGFCVMAVYHSSLDMRGGLGG